MFVMFKEHINLFQASVKASIACTNQANLHHYQIFLVTRGKFLPSILCLFVDSVQSRSFAADISNLKDLLERGKADLFLESKARAQLAAECQSLTVLLTERVGLIRINVVSARK